LPRPSYNLKNNLSSRAVNRAILPPIILLTTGNDKLIDKFSTFWIYNKFFTIPVIIKMIDMFSSSEVESPVIESFAR
jgi:hypothetical protein